MAFYTLSHSNSVEGFPSFYSYEPEWMVGMNNYFYSFKGGNLWRHNSDSVGRCNWYGSQNLANISTVFNTAPLQPKVFKTLILESDQPWDCSLGTDVIGNLTVRIHDDWFVQKEGAYFAFMRYNDGSSAASSTPPFPAPTTTEYPRRSINGIGQTDNNDPTNPAAQILTFPVGVEINSMTSIGDNVLFVLNPAPPPASNNLTLMGEVIGINRGARQLTIDASCADCNTPAVVAGVTSAFFVYAKSELAESYGVLGHYMTITLTNASTAATELFAIESEIMKSNP